MDGTRIHEYYMISRLVDITKTKAGISLSLLAGRYSCTLRCRIIIISRRMNRAIVEPPGQHSYSFLPSRSGIKRGKKLQRRGIVLMKYSRNTWSAMRSDTIIVYYFHTFITRLAYVYDTQKRELIKIIFRRIRTRL